MNVSCIILNYNDADTTMKLVRSIKDYRALDSIVVVDNQSTDDSVTRLDLLKSSKVHVICADQNGGYGSGNNLGIRFACDTLKATHVLIANPDVLVTEETIVALKTAIRTKSHAAITAAIPVNQSGKTGILSWKLTGLLFDLLDTGLFTRRLFGRWLSDDPRNRGFLLETVNGSERCAFVDAVPGSLLLADVNALNECGCYDENVFLYYEEKILGYQLREKGYQTLLLLDRTYVHLHSVSIDKSIRSILKKQALLHRSKLHYYKTYLRINWLQELVAKGFLEWILLEIWFLTTILRMSW